MLDKNILLQERIGLERVNEFVRIGIPFSKGEITDSAEMAIFDPDDNEQACQTSVMARWTDGSIKWALLDFQATLPANAKKSYHLRRSTRKNALPAIQIQKGNSQWTVNTGSMLFSVDVKEFRPISSVQSSQQFPSPAGRCYLHLSDNRRLTPIIDRAELEAAGPLRAVIAVQGHFQGQQDCPALFSGRLHFFAHTSRMQMEFTIQNPRRAQHPGGLWDLGDPASLFFRELAFELDFADGKLEQAIYSLDTEDNSFQFGHPDRNLRLYQESSGGEQWRSPVHRNCGGIVPYQIRGYELRDGTDLISSNLRATPILWCGFDHSGISVSLPEFWQEFPKAIASDKNQIKISLFPDWPHGLHELQAGEQKTSLLYLDFGCQPNDLAWTRSPLSIAPQADVIRNSGVMEDFPLPAGDSPDEGEVADLFLPDPRELADKREIIDEYGWRNYGEVYADHEAVYHTGSEPFISHYNNQYDICAGMYRKFLATGNPLWGELAADLAKHIIDIDIYHTNEDREEYNHGLFWHTDHYVKAGLATHRTYSKEQSLEKKGPVMGGGPAAEHCYTTGLMLHYYLTGNPTFRECVLQMADWCYSSLDAAPTFLGLLKKAHLYLNLWRLAGKTKNKPFPRYPLSRGTGNAINACLDAFELSGDDRYLKRVDTLIRGSVHPGDDIPARDLLNPEISWSYTVLLSSIARSLVKMEAHERMDETFAYARACLLRYAKWMAENEYPYLNRPEILEYPNETWGAQELRKSVIFYRAAQYSEASQRDLYLERANFFCKTAVAQISGFATSRLTRPVALMLQNGWIRTLLNTPLRASSAPSGEGLHFPGSTPMLSLPSIMERLCQELGTALLNASFRREFRWIASRMTSRQVTQQTACSSRST